MSIFQIEKNICSRAVQSIINLSVIICQSIVKLEKTNKLFVAMVIFVFLMFVSLRYCLTCPCVSTLHLKVTSWPIWTILIFGSVIVTIIGGTSEKDK